MDLISHPNGRYPREDGAPRHSVPGACQHLQQCHHQHTQGGGAHSNRSMDVGLYPICVRSPSRVSTSYVCESKVQGKQKGVAGKILMLRLGTGHDNNIDRAAAEFRGNM